MSFEDISDRYGLAMVNVTGVADLGRRDMGAPWWVGFAYQGGLAVADGTNVTRYDDPSFANLAGGGGRAAGVAQGMVRVFDPAQMQSVSFPLDGAASVAFGADGRMVVATGHELYLEGGDHALHLKIHLDGAPIHGLASSGDQVWYAQGTELGTVGASGVTQTSGANVPADAALIGSPTGDVWTLSSGQLARFATIHAGADECGWNNTVRPVFARACASCHLPGGTANIDLSTYASWQARRALIKQRVVVDHSMPPAGNPISDADRATVAQWAM
jgi:hypothetical protein